MSSAGGDFSLVRSRKLAAASPPGLCLAGPGWRPQLSRPAVSDGYAKFPLRFSLSFALSFFGPSLGTPFSSGVLQTLLRPLLTAPGLSAGGSPRVRVCSFRSRLWALQSAVSDCRASRVLACSPPTPCLTAHLCSFGRTFACRPFALAPCGDDLAVRLRLASLPPSGTFHPDRPDPCRAHERDRSPVAAAAITSRRRCRPSPSKHSDPLRAGTSRAPLVAALPRWVIRGQIHSIQ